MGTSAAIHAEHKLILHHKRHNFRERTARQGRDCTCNREREALLRLSMRASLHRARAGGARYLHKDHQAAAGRNGCPLRKKSRLPRNPAFSLGSQNWLPKDTIATFGCTSRGPSASWGRTAPTNHPAGSHSAACKHVRRTSAKAFVRGTVTQSHCHSMVLQTPPRTAQPGDS